MKYKLHKEQQLRCDINTAWKFFSSPHNLSRITPADMKFMVKTDLLDESIYEGMMIDYKVAPLLRIPLNWQTEITQVEPQKSFMDVQKKGPFKLWKHFHEFIPNDKGVLMKDTVKYELPFSFIGALTHWLIVGKRIEQIFEYRRLVLEELF